jgi:Holliday junction resolvasome RuvABC endonuclease subunit
VISLSPIGNILTRGVLKSNAAQDKEDRIVWVGNEIINIVCKCEDPIVFMEAPAFYAQGNALVDMGALNFHIRIRLRQMKVPYAVISPTSLKKFVCGATKGTGSKKELMLMMTYKRWGVEFHDNNLCDAYGLARMAHAHYTTPSKTKLRLRS